MTTAWHITSGPGPLVAAAIHAGHEVREEVLALMSLAEEDRLREEDPFTDAWTLCAPTRVAVALSRFEVDLNRKRDQAVYLTPEDAWGLDVWRDPPSKGIVARSLWLYDDFYAKVADLFAAKVREDGFVLVLDLHSYNHRREGPDAAPSAQEDNPDVNVGTGSLDRERWGPVVEAFMGSMRQAQGPAGDMDVRENVRFRGGHFPTWVHEQFGEGACVLAIEMKKTFMDEWTGSVEVASHRALGEALEAAARAALHAAWGVVEG